MRITNYEDRANVFLESPRRSWRALIGRFPAIFRQVAATRRLSPSGNELRSRKIDTILACGFFRTFGFLYIIESMSAAQRRVAGGGWAPGAASRPGLGRPGRAAMKTVARNRRRAPRGARHSSWHVSCFSQLLKRGPDHRAQAEAEASPPQLLLQVPVMRGASHKDRNEEEQAQREVGKHHEHREEALPEVAQALSVGAGPPPGGPDLSRRLDRSPAIFFPRRGGYKDLVDSAAVPLVCADSLCYLPDFQPKCSIAHLFRKVLGWPDTASGRVTDDITGTRPTT